MGGVPRPRTERRGDFEGASASEPESKRKVDFRSLDFLISQGDEIMNLYDDDDPKKEIEGYNATLPPVQAQF
ncbi:hypothetical protein RCL_jg16701.t1 [Rhizophagus clarus]|uniref:Uncharacterized protein n=1 Tax=Rhizophagus clarus TaxID=94130 RepID=A0A8H3LPF9_9GLOM|nr:hypothetical protein RCL_jg16701.t1 [Rhizophagus clarus]